MTIAVLVTIPKGKAKRLAKKLLERKVCACVNILKEVESLFWWKEKIDTAKESLLIIKTQTHLFEKLKETIKKYHPYDIPEVIGFKIDNVNKDYLDWIKEETCD
mgnify:CR=1 FL=1